MRIGNSARRPRLRRRRSESLARAGTGGYSRAMNIEEIRSYKNAKPFTPFDLVLDDGSTVFVALGERMAITPNGRAVYVGEKDGFAEVIVSRVKELRLRGQSRRVESNS